MAYNASLFSNFRPLGQPPSQMTGLGGLFASILGPNGGAPTQGGPGAMAAPQPQPDPASADPSGLTIGGASPDDGVTLVAPRAPGTTAETPHSLLSGLLSNPGQAGGGRPNLWNLLSLAGATAHQAGGYDDNAIARQQQSMEDQQKEAERKSLFASLQANPNLTPTERIILAAGGPVEYAKYLAQQNGFHSAGAGDRWWQGGQSGTVPKTSFDGGRANTDFGDGNVTSSALPPSYGDTTGRMGVMETSRHNHADEGLGAANVGVARSRVGIDATNAATNQGRLGVDQTSPNAVVGGLMGKRARGEALSPGEQQILDAYNQRGSMNLFGGLGGDDYGSPPAPGGLPPITARPPAAAPANGQPPPEVLQQIPEGQQTTYRNGQTWARQNGQFRRVK